MGCNAKTILKGGSATIEGVAISVTDIDTKALKVTVNVKAPWGGTFNAQVLDGNGTIKEFNNAFTGAKISMKVTEISNYYVTKTATISCCYTEGEKEQPGEISVKSTPDGANIDYDGRRMTSTTPATLSSVPAGTHTIQLSKDGFRSVSKSVDVPAGGKAFVEKILEPIIDPNTRLTMSTNVNTVEVGEKLRISGKLTDGNGNPVPSARIELYDEDLVFHDGLGVSAVTYTDGTYNISWTAEKLDDVGSIELYAKFSGNSKYNASKSSTESITVKYNITTGTIAVNSQPQGAIVYLNGDKQTKPASAIYTVEAGDYEVKAELEGHDPITKNVTVTTGRQTAIEMKFVADENLCTMLGYNVTNEGCLDALLVAIGDIAVSYADFYTLLFHKSAYTGEPKEPDKWVYFGIAAAVIPVFKVPKILKGTKFAGIIAYEGGAKIARAAKADPAIASMLDEMMIFNRLASMEPEKADEIAELAKKAAMASGDAKSALTSQLRNALELVPPIAIPNKYVDDIQAALSKILKDDDVSNVLEFLRRNPKATSVFIEKYAKVFDDIIDGKKLLNGDELAAFFDDAIADPDGVIALIDNLGISQLKSASRILDEKTVTGATCDVFFSLIDHGYKSPEQIGDLAKGCKEALSGIDASRKTILKTYSKLQMDFQDAMYMVNPTAVKKYSNSLLDMFANHEASKLGIDLAENVKLMGSGALDDIMGDAYTAMKKIRDSSGSQDELSALLDSVVKGLEGLPGPRDRVKTTKQALNTLADHVKGTGGLNDDTIKHAKNVAELGKNVLDSMTVSADSLKAVANLDDMVKSLDDVGEIVCKDVTGTVVNIGRRKIIGLEEGLKLGKTIALKTSDSVNSVKKVVVETMDEAGPKIDRSSISDEVFNALPETGKEIINVLTSMPDFFKKWSSFFKSAAEAGSLKVPLSELKTMTSKGIGDPNEILRLADSEEFLNALKLNPEGMESQVAADYMKLIRAVSETDSIEHANKLEIVKGLSKWFDEAADGFDAATYVNKRNEILSAVLDSNGMLKPINELAASGLFPELVHLVGELADFFELFTKALNGEDVIFTKGVAEQVMDLAIKDHTAVRTMLKNLPATNEATGAQRIIKLLMGSQQHASVRAMGQYFRVSSKIDDAIAGGLKFEGMDTWLKHVAKTGRYMVRIESDKKMLKVYEDIFYASGKMKPMDKILDTRFFYKLRDLSETWNPSNWDVMKKTASGFFYKHGELLSRYVRNHPILGVGGGAGVVLAVWFCIDNLPFYIYAWKTYNGEAPGDIGDRCSNYIWDIRGIEEKLDPICNNKQEKPNWEVYKLYLAEYDKVLGDYEKYIDEHEPRVDKEAGLLRTISGLNVFKLNLENYKS